MRRVGINPDLGGLDFPDQTQISFQRFTEAAMAATLGKPAVALGCRMAGLEPLPSPEAAVRAVLSRIPRRG